MGKTNQVTTIVAQPDALGVQTFNFDHDTIMEVVLINNEPYFVAVDVCRALDLINPTDHIVKSLDDDEHLLYKIYRAGQQRTVNLINESGLYALIVRSTKPNAKKFRKWVTSEVLPAIRKTGMYAPKQQELPFFSVEVSPTIMASKPTHCLVLNCCRHDGTVKHLFIHYNENDRWFNETTVDMANRLSSASSQIAIGDKATKEYFYSWLRIEDGRYKPSSFKFCKNLK